MDHTINQDSTMPRSKLSIWVVDDNGKFRKDIVGLIESTPDLICKGAFSDCEMMFDRIRTDRLEMPDVVLMDYQLSSIRGDRCMTGIDGTRQLKAIDPEIAIVMLTQNDETQTIYDSLGAGASGYLVKPSKIDQLVEAIRHAHRGGMWMPPEVAVKVRDFFNDRPSISSSSELMSLTARERVVLTEMAKGNRQKEIADTLSVSRHTVDSHIRSIYMKLHARSGAEAVAKGLITGEIKLDLADWE